MELTGKGCFGDRGSQGIGKAVALLLARNGADIVVSDINLEKAEETAKEIETLGRRAMAVKANVAVLSEVEQMVQAIIEQFGQIDILVNNAGIARDKLILRMTEEDWDAVLDVNLKGTFNCTKAVIRHMSKQRSGKIVNIASVVGEMGNAGQANYSASKAGVIGLTKTIAREFASKRDQCQCHCSRIYRDADDRGPSGKGEGRIETNDSHGAVRAAGGCGRRPCSFLFLRHRAILPDRFERQRWYLYVISRR